MGRRPIGASRARACRAWDSAGSRAIRASRVGRDGREFGRRLDSPRLPRLGVTGARSTGGCGTERVAIGKHLPTVTPTSETPLKRLDARWIDAHVRSVREVALWSRFRTFNLLMATPRLTNRVGHTGARETNGEDPRNECIPGQRM